MVIFHIDGHAFTESADNNNASAVEWIDSFVRAFDQVQDSKATTLTLLITGPFTSPSPASSNTQILDLDGYCIRRPLQSAQSSIQYFAVSRRLLGVARCDAFQKLQDFSQFHLGAYSCLPVNRLLQDISYKLGFGKKYGA